MLMSDEVLIEERLIILPCDPEWNDTLGQRLPPDWIEFSHQLGQACTFVVSAESGIMRPATPADLDDYICGGEYEERQRQLGFLNDDLE
jgi:hypothetical protein